ncbi:hypothetical protein HDF12_001005 [Edaphobacter lichenicola]|uniref:Uncharacterized protein n=2 Tax=Tunturiibacter TaxID=3154218 RepID=A0A7Y9T8N9_9BACT|nr:hypothetical protein [Edaphobacter lichenicola]NYF50640.1 hypothetical protein [Edaphobacter lichenicola]
MGPIAATLISSGNNGCDDILDQVKIQHFEVSYYGDSDSR